MKYKKVTLAMMIASSVFVSGCNDDEVEYKTPPEDLAKITQLSDEVSELQATNHNLRVQNTALVAQVEKLSVPKFEAYDFVTQCAAAGITFSYKDPNAPELVKAQPAKAADRSTNCSDCHSYDGDDTGVTIPHGDQGDCANCHDAHSVVDPDAPTGDATDPTFTQPEFGSGAIDGFTGASGGAYYKSGSYLNAEWLKKQLNTQVKNYRWREAGEEETGVSTIAAACVVEGREHMLNMFPTDGKSYVVDIKENAIGAKLVSTVNKVSGTGSSMGSTTPNIATFGFGLKEVDGDYYANMFIGKNNTCYNIIMNGEARLSYYEYDPTQFQKTGLDTSSRNRGARILTTTDYAKTGLYGFDWYTPVEGLGIGEAFTPEDVDWSKVGACNITLKVENIIPLG
ncbi:hypothetical protein [Shewanella gelidii]|nr:hypothetical protein [Shewanella gelidii]MCL1097402.1 hypothetical protein [Shewanella gelidii]